MNPIREWIRYKWWANHIWGPRKVEGGIQIKGPPSTLTLCEAVKKLEIKR